MKKLIILGSILSVLAVSVAVFASSQTNDGSQANLVPECACGWEK